MYGKYKTNLLCLNCGKSGHIQSRCLYPINSWGLICISHNNKFKNIFNMTSNYISLDHTIKPLLEYVKYNIKFLIIRRKHSLCYVEFLRGRYYYDNLHYICNMISKMSIPEQSALLNKEFSDLWCDMWDIKSVTSCHLSEYNMSNIKFNNLRAGVMCQFNKTIPVFIRLETIILMNKSIYNTPEWELPKGRKNINEKELVCAEREFKEETNIKQHEYTMLLDNNEFIEKYVGSDGVTYKNNYFLAELNNEPSDIKVENTEFQKNEIGDIKWATYVEIVELFREYSIAKKNVLHNILYVLCNVILKTNNTSQFIQN